MAAAKVLSGDILEAACPVLTTVRRGQWTMVVDGTSTEDGGGTASGFVVLYGRSKCNNCIRGFWMVMVESRHSSWQQFMVEFHRGGDGAATSSTN
uniref:Uncharacterized protein n=1 Tax=Oryza barthii TaxID=65489 RepID=A0A0D3HMH2_9ORYZ